ncbi:MAG: hypothetical protein CM1200mP9_02080 [Gammaproteobacteria bacterium]|nr:MAG: hypothetical protein CM1200mP9_02080 [Gammaproteobacteria bacterium]
MQTRSYGRGPFASKVEITEKNFEVVDRFDLAVSEIVQIRLSSRTNRNFRRHRAYNALSRSTKSSAMPGGRTCVRVRSATRVPSLLDQVDRARFYCGRSNVR